MTWWDKEKRVEKEKKDGRIKGVEGKCEWDKREGTGKGNVGSGTKQEFYIDQNVQVFWGPVVLICSLYVLSFKCYSFVTQTI